MAAETTGAGAALLELGLELERYRRDESSRFGHRDRDDAEPTQLLDLIRFQAQEHPDPDVFLKYWDDSAEREKERFGTPADTLSSE